MHRVRIIQNHLFNSATNINTNATGVLFKKKKPKRSFYGDLVAYVLLNKGVSSIFTLTGGHISPIIVGCDEIGINVIDVRDEVTTVFAADASARINNAGIPGIAVVTAGPGLTNTITALKNAEMAESPVILFGGATMQYLKGRGSLQDIDQIALVKPHVKWYKTLHKVDEILPTIYNAFKISMQGVPGVVFIECPLEILYTPLNTKTFNKYINSYKPSPIQPLIGNNVNINYELIMEKLKTAKRPLMILGAQMVNCQFIDDNKIKYLLSCIQSFNVPLYLSGMARGLFSVYNKLHLRHKRRFAVKECDLIFLLGVSCDFRLDYGRGINKKAFVIMVNIDENKLNINNDWRRKDLLYQYHPSQFILNLFKYISTQNMTEHFQALYGEWMDKLLLRDRKRETEIDLMMVKNEQTYNLQTSYNSSPVSSLFVDPIRCCRIIDNVLNANVNANKDIYIVADGGDFVGTASYIIKPNRFVHWLDPGAFGTLGCGAGFAIGIKSLKPNSTVIILYGDGAFGWSLCEFDTLARHKFNVIAIIGNDACWSQIARGQNKQWNNSVATDLKYTNYEQIVEPFGCKGICVKTSNELPSALNLALTYSKQGYPVVINVLLSKSNFRDGSASI